MNYVGVKEILLTTKKNRLREHSYTAALALHTQAPQTPQEQKKERKKVKEADKTHL